MKTVNKIRVYDMDGTIVCSLHRYKTVIGPDGIERINLAFWRENEYRAYSDSLLPMAEQYKADLREGNTFVIIATARVLHAPDRAFIRDFLGEPHYIISRAADDTRSGGLLKVLGLSALFDENEHLRAVEDRIFYEDNIAYLKTVCDHFNMTGVYVPSKQGH